MALRNWQFQGLAAAALAALPGPVAAQSAGADYRTDRDHGRQVQAPGPEGLVDEAEGWTLAFLLPVNWQSNLTSVKSGLRNGDELAPEMSLSRSWQLGAFELAVEGGVYLSAMFPIEDGDSSGWFGSATLSAGDPSEHFSPYVSYQPVAVYGRVFGPHELTRHTFSLGVARAFGGTFIDAFANRSPGTAPGSDRTALGLSLGQTWTAGDGLLQLRADAEHRFYDWDEAFDGKRQVTRGRLRAEYQHSLTPAVDLLVGAEVQRYWSNDAEWDFTNFVVGPTLVARFGF